MKQKVFKNGVSIKIPKNKGKIFCFVILTITFISIAYIKVHDTSAKIEKIWTEHNVYQNDRQGMKIHVKFSVNNMLNKTGQCIAYLFNKNGNVLVNYNQRMVSFWYTFTPVHANCVYEDFVIFVPYKELPLTDLHDMKFQVEVLDNNLKSITQSNYYDFWIGGNSEYDKNYNEYVSLNRNYNWYINQEYTGYASKNNCGPTCTAMAAKWSDNSFNKSVEDIRNTYPNDGNGWPMSKVYDFLINNDIPCVKLPVQDKISETAIKKHLNSGSIIIVTINTKDITYNKNAEERTGKYYISEGNHFIIIKGYRVTESGTFLEVYDPDTWDKYYSDCTPKGKDRYYLSTEVVSSILNRGGNYIVVSPK